MSKFKVGDRVRATKSGEPYFEAGEGGKVLSVAEGSSVFVLWDDTRYGDGRWFVNKHDIVLEHSSKTRSADEFITTREIFKLLRPLDPTARARVLEFTKEHTLP